jgi:hypothetical protein
MNMDLYGYSGKVLRVDLTKGVARAEALPPQVIENYLGGVGFGSQYLYTENPEGIRWPDPDNRLILANGPFSNTPLHGSGIHCLSRFPLQCPVHKISMTVQDCEAVHPPSSGACKSRQQFQGSRDQLTVKGIAFLYLPDPIENLQRIIMLAVIW